MLMEIHNKINLKELNNKEIITKIDKDNNNI